MANNPEPEPNAKLNVNANAVLAMLRDAVNGLLYMSESNEPFDVVYWKGDCTPLDAGRVLKLAGHPPDTPIAVVPLDDFFKDLTQDQDWFGEEEKVDAQRYRKLLDVIKSRLTDAKVYRIGEVNVEIYIVGQTPGGDWAGVKTLAVET